MFQRLVYKLFIQSREEKSFLKRASGIRIGKGLLLRFAPSAKVEVGKGTDLRNYISLWVGNNAELKLGDNVFMNNFCSVNCLKSVEIGEHSIFGEGVRIYDHNHLYTKKEGELDVDRKNFSYAGVKIGRNCWLGSNVVVLKGVNIGDNSIIGGGCIIHEDIPSGSVIVNKQELISK